MRSPSLAVSLWLLASAAMVTACSDKVAPIVLQRPNCNVCHQPLNGVGEAHGIEEAHPWYPLSCTDCHGGNDFDCDGTITVDDAGDRHCDGTLLYDQDRAHVSPGSGPKYIKNLSARQLDNLNPDYVRFINPGDFRVAQVSCGSGNPQVGAAGGCHQKLVEAVPTSTMGHTSGEITVARYRAGAQDDALPRFGPRKLVDPNFDPTIPGSVESLEVFDPAAINLTEGEPSVADLQDQYMVKSCFRCHLSGFGENAYPGDFRSSGCTACHMPYADDGLSRSEDPWVNKNKPPRPVTHEMVTAAPIETCMHCHYRGARIGISYQGYRESAGGKDYEDQSNVEHLGVTVHNHPPTYYVVDEDTTNVYDETPPDLHFEAGMHCVDCHHTVDVHGDGHIYGDTQVAVTSECEDCHGSVREYAKLDPNRTNFFKRDGQFFLNTKVTHRELKVVQTKDTVTKGNPDYSPLAEQSMGVDANGFSHTDELECYTCHASWFPSCYGCHVTLDMTREKPYHTTGVLQPGSASGSRAWVVLNDLVLMRNTDGKIAPSMPAERFFMYLEEEDKEASRMNQQTVVKRTIDARPRSFTFPDGRTIAGFGQRTVNPHTTRKRSQFMACDRCHSVGSKEAPTNKVLLDLTHGYGTQRFPTEGECVTPDAPGCGDNGRMTYQLDRIITDDGKPLVVVGHPEPNESRVLNPEEIQRMRDVVIENPPYSTEIPDDAATNTKWPKNSVF